MKPWLKIKQWRAVFLAVFAASLVSTLGYAQGGEGVSVSGGGISNGVLLGSRVFFFSDQSSLGADTLNDGSAVLTRFDAQYNFEGWYSGLGLFYETDTYGGLQTDTIMGFIGELYIGNLFLKIMPGSIKQEYTNRSFSERTGSFSAFEIGIRATLISGIAFYEFAIQQRTKTIEREDDRDMASPYSETQLFPVLGIGVSI